MKTLSLLAIALVSLPGLLSAAPAAAEQPVNVRAISFHQDFPAEIHAHDPTGSSTAGLIEVKSFLNHEPNTLKIKGNRLVFTRKSNPVSATDVSELLGDVELPAGSKSFILVFLPDSVEPGNQHSRVIAIDDSVKEFPAGSFKVANFSASPVKILLEKDTFEYAPGDVKVIDKPPFGENQAASMEAYFKKDDEWKMISTGSWPNPGTRRVLQVFTENLATKEIELKGIRDVVVP
ncbi:MAG: hypothetical protein V4819_04755 [Verrucomicrobiota bacterium]